MLCLLLTSLFGQLSCRTFLIRQGKFLSLSSVFRNDRIHVGRHLHLKEDRRRRRPPIERGLSEAPRRSPPPSPLRSQGERFIKTTPSIQLLFQGRSENPLDFFSARGRGDRKSPSYISKHCIATHSALKRTERK